VAEDDEKRVLEAEAALAQAQRGVDDRVAGGVTKDPSLKASAQIRLTLDGILLTMYEQNNPASDRVVEYVRKHLPANIVFDVVIPRSVATADAFAAGQPVVVRSPADAAAQAYVNLATILADRLV
jgi:cellulose biosynthesis protein BcsQ